MGVIDTCVNMVQDIQGQCYVVTTGYGPVDAFQMRRAYNVPGQTAVTYPSYRAFIERRIVQLLEKAKRLPFIVYYAGKSRGEFREFIWSIINDIDGLKAVMYGARQHPVGWNVLAPEIMLALMEKNEEELGRLERGWISDNPNIAPFFKVSDSFIS